MCGSPMRIDAELMEGQRRYCWYKCTNIRCGAIFLVQDRIREEQPAARRQQAYNSQSA